MAPPVKFTAARKAAFLEALSRTANVGAAARIAGVSRRRANEVRLADPAFAQGWAEAIAAATDALESEARRRAVKGWEEPVFYQGQRVGVIRRYSDRLLELLLRAHRAEIYRPRPDAEYAGGGPSLFEKLVRARKRLEAHRARQAAAQAEAQAAPKSDVDDR